jgi:hypothetical protein
MFPELNPFGHPSCKMCVGCGLCPDYFGRLVGIVSMFIS